MNDLTKAYCDGASMAYRDMGAKMKQMIDRAPSEIRGLMIALEPLADACVRKATEVYAEVERFETATRQ